MIQRLEPAHVHAYRELMLEAYAMHPEAFTSSAEERAALPLSWWAARLTPGDAATELVLGAFVEGQLAGIAGLSFETRAKICHKAKLFGVYVPLPFQRRGLGEELVRAALGLAQARAGIELVQLTVSAGNTGAQHLYERCGFTRYGLEPRAMRFDGQDIAKLLMWCDLTRPH